MLLFVDKPSGYTSFAVVAKIKRLYGDEKVGHAGTLDPMATGLLIIGIGDDTKRLGEFLDADKTYIATIDFSKHSDTWDMDYRETFKQLPIDTKQLTIDVGGTQVQFPSVAKLEAALDTIIGDHLIPLTPFSARKIRGKKMYEHARAGSPIFLDTPMTMRSYEIVEYAFPTVTIQFVVGSGTYIRSLAHRLGKTCGFGSATLTMLRRTKVANRSVP